MKDMIIEMLSIDLERKDGIGKYFEDFGSTILKILNVDTSPVLPKEDQFSLSPDAERLLQETVESFQYNYQNMVVTRIKDKYDNCQRMPLKKTFMSHIISFILDYRVPKKEIPRRDFGYEHELRKRLRRSLNDDYKKSGKAPARYFESFCSPYSEIAERFRTEICMKAFFEDEAHIFTPIYKTRKNMKEFIAEALSPNCFDDGILDIWANAIENGLPNQFFPRQII